MREFASAVLVARACPEGDQAGPRAPAPATSLSMPRPVQQPWEIVVEATIMVLEIIFTVVRHAS